MLDKVISGGQNGADEAGLRTAKEFGIRTGGHMPKGFRTLDGNKPQFAELFDVKEHQAHNYKDRTWCNVENSDITLRFFDTKHKGSPGEKCTLNAINRYGKPYKDIEFRLRNSVVTPEDVATLLIADGHRIINVAGNSENTYPGIYGLTCDFLAKVFYLLGHRKQEQQ